MRNQIFANRIFNEAYAHTQRKTLIQESIKQVKQVYLSTDKITPEEFTELKKVTEINPAKYIFRITKWYVESDKELDLSTVPEVIEWFDANSVNLEKNDIARYNDFDELVNAMDAREIEKASYDMTDVNVIFEDENVLFCQPLSNTASNNLSSDMGWCISPKESINWHHYTIIGHGRFMFWFDKNVKGEDGKFCTQYNEFNGPVSFDKTNAQKGNYGFDMGHGRPNLLDMFPEEYHEIINSVRWEMLEEGRGDVFVPSMPIPEYWYDVSMNMISELEDLIESLDHWQIGPDDNEFYATVVDFMNQDIRDIEGGKYKGRIPAEVHISFNTVMELDKMSDIMEEYLCDNIEDMGDLVFYASEYYSHDYKNNRFIGAEKVILKQAGYDMVRYASWVIKGRWLEAEPLIAKLDIDSRKEYHDDIYRVDTTNNRYDEFRMKGILDLIKINAGASDDEFYKIGIAAGELSKYIAILKERGAISRSTDGKSWITHPYAIETDEYTKLNGDLNFDFDEDFR